MKIHSQKCEILLFCAIFLLFILPSLCFTNNSVDSNTIFNWTFPFLSLILSIFSIILYVYKKDSYKDVYKKIPVSFFIFYFVIFFATIALGFLLCNSFIFNFISSLRNNNQIQIIKPQTFFEWICCVLNFIFAAFYEEIIYRFYLPDASKNLFVFFIKNDNNKTKKTISIICEIITLLIFSFSHLYLGIFSVFNAAIGHIILRACYCKSKNIYSSFIAHAAYNIISLILL